MENGCPSFTNNMFITTELFKLSNNEASLTSDNKIDTAQFYGRLKHPYTVQHTTYPTFRGTCIHHKVSQMSWRIAPSPKLWRTGSVLASHSEQAVYQHLIDHYALQHLTLPTQRLFSLKKRKHPLFCCGQQSQIWVMLSKSPIAVIYLLAGSGARLGCRVTQTTPGVWSSRMISHAVGEFWVAL